MLTLLILLLLSWKPIYFVGYLYFYKKDDTALGLAKNWLLSLWDLVKWPTKTGQ